MVALIDMGCCYPKKEDFRGCTPLAWASRKGHNEAVEMLPRQEEIDQDKLDNHRRTPLSQYFEGRQEEVEEIRLGREKVNPDKPDNDGKTPFLWVLQWRRH